MNEKKKLLRLEIYNEIWLTNARKVAEKYNVDYSDLLAACHKANVPIPTSKYRLAQANGKNVDGLKVKLPQSTAKYLYVKVQQPKLRIDEKQPNNDDLDYLDQQFAFLDDPEKVQRIVGALNNASHRKTWATTPEMKAYKASVKKYRNRDEEHYSYQRRYYYEDSKPQPPKFIDNFSLRGRQRAERLLNKLIVIFKEIGEQVGDDLSIVIGKDEIDYELKEDQDQIPHQLTSQEQKELAKYEEEKLTRDWVSKPRIRKYDHPYNGHLRIRFVVSGRHKRFLKDTKKATLEEQLPEIIMAFYQTYLETKQNREQREAEERERKLAEEREERQRELTKSEKMQVAALINEAKDYRLANTIRAYITSAKKQGKVNSDKVKWMESVADWVDPLVSSDHQYLEKRQHGDNDQEKAEYLGDQSLNQNSFSYLNYL